jgi:hypothetical protein
MKKLLLTVAAALMMSSATMAIIRPTDQTGINVFETPGVDSTVVFDGIKTKIGGGFALPYMDLKHSNALGQYNATNAQTLFPLTNNFALPMASLFLNTSLADGITLNMTLYLASKHHNETWVKGGYIQFDKLSFLNCGVVDDVMKYTSFKVGQMDVNYGDAHFRRSDGGHALYNPFMENYIMDEFATEIGAEADFHVNGFIASASVTNGQLNPNLQVIDTAQAANKYSNGQNNPSFVGKVGYDGQLTEQLRIRATGSIYYTAGAYKSTLFGGDRTGSNYSGVMYNAAPGTGTAFNGRYNPGLTDKFTAEMLNLFIKYKPVNWLAIESFSTFEVAKGRSTSESVERGVTQIASDLVFRFGQKENFFIGARYNTMSAEVAAAKAVAAVAPAIGVPAMPAYTIGINRLAISGGWFITKNIMAKIEYVNQVYSNVPNVNYILNGAEFHGVSAEAVIAF